MGKFTLTLLVLAMAVVFTTSAPTTSSSLLRTLETKGTANIFVVMSDKTSKFLSPLKEMSYRSRGERLTSVANTLKSHAAASQASVLSILETIDGLEYTSLWINNQIFISNANLAVIQKLQSIDGISEIVEEEIISLEKITATPVPAHSAGTLAEEGIEKIQADLVWTMPGGTTGEGVIIAEMTTGVRGTHEALRHNFVGDYGWYDPEGRTVVPSDESGIGTFSTGLIAGSGGIGVAPGAKWMACKGCGEFSCQQSTLLLCGQFMACPTNPSGGSPDCTKAPHVVVNNFGGGGSVWFDSVVDAWHAAGITPVFVVGINGPYCGTAGAADNVIGVGAVHMNDTLTVGSSRGPSPQGMIKPDIVAPGVSIRSAYNTNDTAYTVISSTTPASCLVSGTIALVRSASPNVTYDDIREILIGGADTDNLTPTGGDCGGISETIIPNNAYGYGRVNAYKSVILAKEKSRSG